MNGVELVRLLEGYRWTASTEAALQIAVEKVLRARGVDHQREAMLFRNLTVVRPDMACTVHSNEGSHVQTPSDRHKDLRVDFLVGEVALELKVDGSRNEVFSQLLAYAQSPRVAELVVLSTRVQTLAGLPREANGKPLHCAYARRGF